MPAARVALGALGPTYFRGIAIPNGRTRDAVPPTRHRDPVGACQAVASHRAGATGERRTLPSST